MTLPTELKPFVHCQPKVIKVFGRLVGGTLQNCSVEAMEMSRAWCCPVELDFNGTLLTFDYWGAIQAQWDAYHGKEEKA